MKRMTLCIALFIIFSASSLAQIPNEFYGIQLGVTSKKEAIGKLNSHNLTPSLPDTSNVLGFSGDIQIEGISFDFGTLTFSSDKPCIACFIDSCETGVYNEDYQSCLTTLKNKYSTLTFDTTNTIINLLLIPISSLIDESSIWVKNDSNYVIALATNGINKTILSYIDISAVTIMFMKKIMYPEDYNEANKVTSVAGCLFGTEANKAIQFFNSKFKENYSSDYYTASYGNIEFAGKLFDSMTLYFKYNSKSNQREFCAIDFQKHFYTWEFDAAKSAFESLRSLYSGKYTNEKYLPQDEENISCYYGMIEEKYDETLPPVEVRLQKGYSKGGDEYYYVLLQYYMKNTFNLYDDEI